MVPSLGSFQDRFFRGGWNDAGFAFVFVIRNHGEGAFQWRKGVVEELQDPPQAVIWLVVIEIIVAAIYLIPHVH